MKNVIKFWAWYSLLFFYLVFSGCLEIDLVHQTTLVAPGDTLSVQIEIHSSGTDPNPHAVFFTVRVPNDWEPLSLNYQSQKFGNGAFGRSQYWADSCEVVHPSGADYTWHGFLSTRNFLADQDHLPATLDLRLRAGQQPGRYQLGYTLGEDALGYETSYGAVYDSAFHYPIQVVRNLKIPQDFPTIQQGIDAAAPGVTLLISPGVYHENLRLRPGLTLAGSTQGQTIIDGDQRGVVIHGASATTFKNLTLRGAGAGQALVHCEASQIQIIQNQFVLESEMCGVRCDSVTEIKIEQNRFVANGSQTTGVQTVACAIEITNNFFENCDLSLALRSGAVTIAHNIITHSHNLAAKFVDCPGGIFSNNTLDQNQAGLKLENSPLTILNNIIVNSAGIGIECTGAAFLAYNNLWQNAGADYLNCEGGVGAISVAPGFVGGTPYDYHLRSDSPCIDAGDPNSPFDPDGTIADLGALYFPQPGIPSTIRSVYLVQFTHLDIGFTDPQDVVAGQYKGILDLAITYAERIANFKWTIESVWQLEQWLKRSTPAEIARLQTLVATGKIELGAGYATMHTAVLGTEELNRWLYPMAAYRQQFGFQANTIFQNDVPGFAWALPSVLQDAGVPYFIAGVNQSFGGSAKLPRSHNPFYWAGPDGKRVLTWISAGSYVEWYTTFQMYQFSNFFSRLKSELAQYAAAEYPYDAILILCGSLENTNPTTIFSGLATKWNKTYVNPKLIIAPPSEFFQHLEQKYGQQFATYAGDWAGAWDLVSLNAPQSMRLVRETHAAANTAEKLASLNTLLSHEAYATTTFNNIYQNMLQFDEHSGGGTPWPGLMTPSETQRQSEIAVTYARAAYDSTRLQIQNNLEKLAQCVKIDAPGIFVFNPLSWTRTDLARVQIDPAWASQSFDLIDLQTRQSVAYQWSPDFAELFFIAPRIPALGYKVFKLQLKKSAPRSGSQAPQSPRAPAGFHANGASGAIVMENDFYQLTIEVETGTIRGLVDKMAGRELVNANSRFAFNAAIKATAAQTLAGQCEIVPLGIARIDSAWRGPVVQGLRINRVGTPLVCTDIWLFPTLPRVEIHNLMDRQQMPWVPLVNNADYYAYCFPFNLPGFQVWLEGATGFWNPRTDHLPGAPRGYFAIQQGGSLTSGNYRIQWAQREAFLAEFARFHGAETDFSPSEATLITRIIKKEDEGKFEDGSIGPIDAEPGLGPEIVNRYAFTTASAHFDPVASARFNSDFSNPLLACWVTPAASGLLTASCDSFFTVDQPNILLINIKKANDNQGLIFRLLEIAGQPALVSISSHFFDWVTAELTSPVEAKMQSVAVGNEGVSVFFNPHEMKTIAGHLNTFTGWRTPENSRPRQFELFQNFPNPFNPTTILRYRLATSCPVQIQIFNVQGQLVYGMAPALQTAGLHEFQWDGRNQLGQTVASGLYLYLVQAGTEIQPRKLLLLR